MIYKVEFLPQVIKTLEKLDKYTKRIIIDWISKNLEGTNDPHRLGKPLFGDRNGQWRYRLGDYRILALIEQSKVIVLSIGIGHNRK